MGDQREKGKGDIVGKGKWGGRKKRIAKDSEGVEPKRH